MGWFLEIGAILLPISHCSPRSDLQRLCATASVLSGRLLSAIETPASEKRERDADRR